VRLAALPSLALAGALALGLGGCQPPSDGGPSDGDCDVDEECGGGEVCARDNLCWSASDVRSVRTTWTLRGQPADTTKCARFPDLYIQFRGPGVENLGFSPVPCANGQFFVDKLPREFTRVEVGTDDNTVWDNTPISSAGSAALDLAF
jgi:hypothetical protein